MTDLIHVEPCKGHRFAEQVSVVTVSGNFVESAVIDAIVEAVQRTSPYTPVEVKCERRYVAE